MCLLMTTSKVKSSVNFPALSVTCRTKLFMEGILGHTNFLMHCISNLIEMRSTELIGGIKLRMQFDVLSRI